AYSVLTSGPYPDRFRPARGSHARPGFVEIKTPRAGAMARKAGYENEIQKSVEYADTWRALMNRER
ncbi:MAG: hypothetical protein MUQ27_13890, partial [Acidimicrobiia bacterium]|nr:hypothetical protein [Acidimicrobiia bacterium]